MQGSQQRSGLNGTGATSGGQAKAGRKRRLWPWVVLAVFALATYFGLPLLNAALTTTFTSISATM